MSDFTNAVDKITHDISAIRGWTDALEADVKAANEAYNAMVLLEGPSKHLLAVPWIGQNVPSVTTDDYSNSDCGPACVAMWLNYLRASVPVTVDDVSKATGLPVGYKYTIPGNLITAAAKWNLKLDRVINLSPAAIRAQIDAGNPSIILVHYGSLEKRWDANFTGGHYVIVVGYTDDTVIYNDPYWPTDAGHNLEMRWPLFIQAMQDCTKDSNTPNQGVMKVNA